MVGFITFWAIEFRVSPDLYVVSPLLAPLWVSVQVCIAISFCLWIYCWVLLMFIDPGRVTDDLRRRGILRRVQLGDIPTFLQHLRICPECNVPCPIGSVHCSECGGCHLRWDHHCAFTGHCVADRNSKLFVISFFWGGICATLMTVPGAVLCCYKLRTTTLFSALHTLGFMLMMFVSGGNFVVNNFALSKTLHKYIGINLSLGKYWASFGRKWWEKILPIRLRTTQLSWPGIEWANQSTARL
jgi:hypothetical protein